MSEGNNKGVSGGDQQHRYSYGTFQGVANYYPPPQPLNQPVIGFPQPVPPVGSSGDHRYYHHGYQSSQGYAVVEGRPIILRERRLPCCGIGIGWFLFIIGFFLGGIPWYVGAFILVCARVDYREKPGYVACTLASILVLIALTLGVSKETHGWRG